MILSRKTSPEVSQPLTSTYIIRATVTKPTKFQEGKNNHTGKPMKQNRGPRNKPAQLQYLIIDKNEQLAIAVGM